MFFVGFKRAKHVVILKPLPFYYHSIQQSVIQLLTFVSEIAWYKRRHFFQYWVAPSQYIKNEKFDLQMIFA